MAAEIPPDQSLVQKPPRVSESRGWRTDRQARLFFTRSASAPIPQSSGNVPPPHPSPAAYSTASSPSGGRTTPLIEGRSPPPRPPGSPPRHPPPAAEGLFALDVILFTYTAGVTVGVTPQIKDLNDSWGTAAKACFGIALMVCIASLGVGIMAAVHRGFLMSRRRKLSAFCARFGTVVSTALFIIATSCTFGRVGCVAGVFAAAVVAGIMISVWIYEKPSAAEAVSSFWGRIRMWRQVQGGPAAEEIVQLASIVTQQ